jgi:asparagine synthetase B (glutamine-hydrolysing)
VRRYGTLPIDQPLYLKRREEYVEQFLAHFDEAVSDRLPEGPTGIFMSGGLDSPEGCGIRFGPTPSITLLFS